MQKYSLSICFSKSKPLIILSFDEATEIVIDKSWKKKVKKIDEKTYHLSTTMVEDVFFKNSDKLGNWNEAHFDNWEIEKYYGFVKCKGMEIHSMELSKRFISDWIQEDTKLIRYTISTSSGSAPIIEECLYDAGIYGDGYVGNITEDELNRLKKVINPDGEIITNIRKKLGI